VTTNSVDQLDLQARHRARARLVSPRTATVNPIRAFLLERGIDVRQGLRFLRQYFPKGTDLAVHSEARLNAVARELNEQPRKTS
jgi:hypothetical protein